MDKLEHSNFTTQEQKKRKWQLPSMTGCMLLSAQAAYHLCQVKSCLFFQNRKDVLVDFPESVISGVNFHGL